MSWPAWTGGGPPQPGVVTTPVMPNSQYTPEQWAQMQQQNWQQWAQWQQQFQQWQQQYGAEYQKSLTALTQTSVNPVQPTMPVYNVTTSAPPPPLPTEVKPPLPPDEPQTTPPLNNPQFLQFTSAPPPIIAHTAPPIQPSQPPPPPKEHYPLSINTSNPPPLMAQSFKNDSSNRFGSNQNFNNKTTRNQNWQNPQTPVVNRFNQPPSYATENFGTKRPYNQSSDTSFDSKRVKSEYNIDKKWPNTKQTHNVQPTVANETVPQWNTKAPSVTQAKSNPEELSEAEKKFDKQFADWESQFKKWKEQNANHPDKEQYKEYEKKWETWRAQLLDRREQMKRKRLGLTDGSPLPAVDKVSQTKHEGGIALLNTAESQNNYQKNPSLTRDNCHDKANTQNIYSNIDTAPLSTFAGQAISNTSVKSGSFTLGNQQVSSEKSNQSDDISKKLDVSEEFKSPDVNLSAAQDVESFLKSSSTDGIPGLDLVKDDKEDEEISKLGKGTEKPDLEAISRGINSILGDQKLMNMLSMVSQNKTNMTETPPIINSSKISLDESALAIGGGSYDNYSNQDNVEFFGQKSQSEINSNIDEQTRSSFNFSHDVDNSGKSTYFNDKRNDFKSNIVEDHDNFNRGSKCFNQSLGRFGQENLNRDSDNCTRGHDNIGTGSGNLNRTLDNFNRDSDHFNTDPDHFNADPDRFNTDSDCFNTDPDLFNTDPDHFNTDPVDDFNTDPEHFDRDFDHFHKDHPHDFNRTADNFNRGFDNFNSDPHKFDRGVDNFNRSLDHFNRGSNNFNRGLDNFSRGSDSFKRGPDNFNKGPDNFNKGPDTLNRRPDNFNRGPDNFNRGLDNFDRGPDNFNRGPGNFHRGPDNFNRGLDNFDRGPDNFNRGPGNFHRGPDNFNRGVDNFNRGPDNFNRGSDSFNKDTDNLNKVPINFNRGPDNFSQDSDNFNRGTDGFNTGSNNLNRGLDNFNRRNDNFNRGAENFNRTLVNSDSSNGGSANFNRGPNNFNRGLDNFNKGLDNFSRGSVDKSTENLSRDSETFSRRPDGFSQESIKFNKGPNIAGHNFDNKSNNFKDFAKSSINSGQDKNVFNTPRESFLNRNVNNLDKKFDNTTVAGNFENGNFNRWSGGFDHNVDNFKGVGDVSNNFREEFQDVKLVNKINDECSRDLNTKDAGDLVLQATQEEVVWKPEKVIDYEHKPLKSGESEISIQLAHTFDYRHKSLNRIPYPQRPEWLARSVKNYPEFDPPPIRQFEQLRRHPVNERFDNRFHYEKYGIDDKNKYLMDRNRPFHDERENKLTDDYKRKSFDEDRRRNAGDDKFDKSRGFERDRQSFNKQSEPFKFSPPHLHANKNISKDENTKDFRDPNKRLVPFRFSPPPVGTIEPGDSLIKFSSKTNKPSIALIDDLLSPAGRYSRPSRIVIILRGPSGSGKSFLAKLIKDKEVDKGGSTPRILCLDDYFMVEQEKEIEEDGRVIKTKEMIYEYEECMEAAYRVSFMKSFKKTITDGYFNFIIVDNVNDKVKHFEEMWSFAKQNGFQVYVCQLELDIQTCTKRNIHGRSEIEIERCIVGWEATPSHHTLVDCTSLIQFGSIPEVEMEEINSPASENMNEEEHMIRSKWDNFDCSVDKLAKLDGTNKPLRPSKTMEDYLRLDDEWVQSISSKPGQKRVRWADLEERKEQEKMREIGFVVGHTNWNRMMDPTMGSGALTQTKYIERYN